MHTLPVITTQLGTFSWQDCLFSCVDLYTRQDWPTTAPPEVKSSFDGHTELTVEGDCIYWGTRVTVHLKLREILIVLQDLNCAHSGMVCMARFRWQKWAVDSCLYFLSSCKVSPNSCLVIPLALARVSVAKNPRWFAGPFKEFCV